MKGREDMLVREALYEDLEGLQTLYLHLHEKELLPDSDALSELWSALFNDTRYHIIVGVKDGQLISSVTLVVIENLTRGMRPYALALIQKRASQKPTRN